MRLKPALLFCGLFSLNLFAAGDSLQTKTNIAVTDLTGQGVDQASATIISDRLRTELFSTGMFKVIERQSMQDILKEQGFQQSGACTDEACLVQMGQLLGVSNIVSGTVGKIGAIFTLNIRLIDVKTGEIVYTTSIDCRGAIEDVLTNSVPAIANKIAVSKGMPVAVAAKSPAVTQPLPVKKRHATGSLRIRTDPSGARIFMDTTDMGLTPFVKDTVGVGSHKMRIELAGYEGLETEISVSLGQTANKKFNLHHTKAWKDSVESARRAAEAPPVPQSPAPGSLSIQTDPPGAKIFVDKADSGLTPFTKDTVGAGGHRIRIELAGYEGLESDISVSSGHTLYETYSLNHTKAWKDSVESARRAAIAVKNTGTPQKKHSIAPKIVFGLLAAGAGVAGGIYNNLEQQKINHDAELKQEYINSGYSIRDYQGQLDANATAARNFNTIRNACFIAAGAFAAGFAVSFAF